MNNKKQHDKLITDLHRLLQTQDFKSEKELSDFLEGIMNQEIPSFPNEVLNLKEKAQDLVYDAYELSPIKAKAKIEKALQLDPECIEAYEFLASLEKTVEIEIVFYEKAISIGRQIFGGKYLEEHKGMFWGFHETRPFMRCLAHYSDCLYTMGKVKESVAVLEEMIELNPNDNQGVRDQLLLYLIELGENKKFLKYEKIFNSDSMAFPLFNRALFAFKTEGETENSNKKLLKAINQNNFVAKLLLSKKPVTDFPDFYSPGDKNEAEYYVFFSQDIWAVTKGALEWLKKHASKS